MDFALIVVNIILLCYLVRMTLNSVKVKVPGKVGPVWIIAVFFFIVGILRLLQGISLFSIFQTVLIIAVGVLYSRMKSGFSDQGLVLLGILYPWDKIQRAEMEKIEETSEIKVDFTVKKVSRFVYFAPDQEEAVDQMLTLYEQDKAEQQLNASR